MLFLSFTTVRKGLARQRLMLLIYHQMIQNPWTKIITIYTTSSTSWRTLSLEYHRCEGSTNIESTVWWREDIFVWLTPCTPTCSLPLSLRDRWICIYRFISVQDIYCGLLLEYLLWFVRNLMNSILLLKLESRFLFLLVEVDFLI